MSIIEKMRRKTPEAELAITGYSFIAELNAIAQNSELSQEQAKAAITELYESPVPRDQSKWREYVATMLEAATADLQSDTQARVYAKSIASFASKEPGLLREMSLLASSNVDNYDGLNRQLLESAAQEAEERLVAVQSAASAAEEQLVAVQSAASVPEVYTHPVVTVPLSDVEKNSSNMGGKMAAAALVASVAVGLAVVPAAANASQDYGRATDIPVAVGEVSPTYGTISLDGIDLSRNSLENAPVVTIEDPKINKDTASIEPIAAIDEASSAESKDSEEGAQSHDLNSTPIVTLEPKPDEPFGVIPLPKDMEKPSAENAPEVSIEDEEKEKVPAQTPAPSTPGTPNTPEAPADPIVIPLPEPEKEPLPELNDHPPLDIDPGNPEKPSEIGKIVGRYSGGEGKNKLDVFFQSDNKWKNIPYTKNNNPELKGDLADCGCGPVSFATAISAMTGEKTDPEKVATWFMEHDGVYTETNCSSNWIWGSNPEAFKKDHGLDIKMIVSDTMTSDGTRKERDFDTAEKALRSTIDMGGMVLMSQRAGTFSHGGHILMVTGYKQIEDGSYRYFVADPNNKERTNSVDGFTAMQVIGNNTPVEGVGYGGAGADRGDLRAAWSMYPTEVVDEEKEDKKKEEKKEKKDGSKGELAADIEKQVKDAEYEVFAKYIRDNVASVGAGSKYNPMDADRVAKLIDKYDKKYKHKAIDREFMAAMFWQESKYDPKASSGAADGFGQFTPGTAGDRGLKNVWDAEESIDASYGYYVYIYDRYEGYSKNNDWPDNLKNKRHLLNMALAGYNAGPNYSVFKKGGIPSNEETNEYRDIILNDLDGIKGAQKKAAAKVKKNADVPKNRDMNRAGDGDKPTEATSEEERLKKVYATMAEALQRNQKWSDVVYPLKSGNYRVTDGNKWRTQTNFHRGLDYGTPIGTDIVAMFDGVITTKSINTDTPACRNLIGKKPDDPIQKNIYLTGIVGGELVTVYMGHLSKYHVTNGQVVKAAEVIAKTGGSGCSTGPHLHIEGSAVSKPGGGINGGNVVSVINSALGKIKPGSKTPDVIMDFAKRLGNAEIKKSSTKSVSNEIKPITGDTHTETQSLGHEHEPIPERFDKGAEGLLTIDHSISGADAREEEAVTNEVLKNARDIESLRKVAELKRKLGQG